jgi:hypothetical protein
MSVALILRQTFLYMKLCGCGHVYMKLEYLIKKCGFFHIDPAMYMESGAAACKPVLAGHTVHGSNHLDLPVYGNNDNHASVVRPAGDPARAWRGQPIWNRKQLIYLSTACQAIDLCTKYVQSNSDDGHDRPGVCRSGWSPAMNGRPRRARLLHPPHPRFGAPDTMASRLLRSYVRADSPLNCECVRRYANTYVLYGSQISGLDMHATVPSLIHLLFLPICVPVYTYVRS